VESIAEGALPFPSGTADVEQYVGEELDRADLQRTAFWVGLARSAGDPIDDCAWGVLAGRPPAERAEAFVSALRQTGATGEWVGPKMDEPDEASLEQALTFLSMQAGKTLE
jgi:hypothetical protein